MNAETTYLLVAGGGALGAVTRYAVGKWFAARMRSDIPWGTLAVNLTGSFLLGMIAGSRLSNSCGLFLGTGFLGAYTTFSTFKLENIQLWKSGKFGSMARYLFLSYALGLVVAYCGYLAVH